MQIKTVFVSEISQRIKVLCASSKKELLQELSNLSCSISELAYKSWVLDTFVVGINSIFGSMVEAVEGDSTQINALKNSIYEKVLKVNPLLHPDNLYISPANNIVFTKDIVKLTECDTWKVIEDPTNLMVLNINDYFQYVENARHFDHYIEVEYWDLLDTSVCIRTFNKNLKDSLIHGFDPKTEDDIKYFIVVLGVDGFQQLYSHITSHPSFSTIPFPNILYSLFDLVIKHNPFLDLKIKDFKNTNKKYRIFKEGTSTETQTASKLRKSLHSVTKKEILNLEIELKKHIFGQDEAVVAVCDQIKKAYLGIKDNKTPIGAFFFYGPTSSGKTEFAKALTRILMKSMSGLIKIPCNTLISSHNLHTLIGSPPGYVGYEEKGLLSKILESGKFKIILFDEIEKADSKIFDLLLEMLEEGEILMANGDVIYLSECLLLFTSNIGQQAALSATNTAGFASTTNEERDRDLVETNEFQRILKKKLKPEFIARLNGMFYFKRLGLDDLKKVAITHLQKHTKNLEKHKMILKYNKQIPDIILNECSKKNKYFHARDIKNFIDFTILHKLGDEVIRTTISSRERLIIDLKYENDGFIFNFMKEREKSKLKKEK